VYKLRDFPHSKPRSRLFDTLGYLSPHGPPPPPLIPLNTTFILSVGPNHHCPPPIGRRGGDGCGEGRHCSHPCSRVADFTSIRRLDSVSSVGFPVIIKRIFFWPTFFLKYTVLIPRHIHLNRLTNGELGGNSAQTDGPKQSVGCFFFSRLSPSHRIVVCWWDVVSENRFSVRPFRPLRSKF